MATGVLIDTVWPRPSEAWTVSGLVRPALLAIAGSLLVAGAAQVSIPMWPVPMTLQTLAVLAVGAAYGSRLGAATLGLYALEGAVGLPFFADGKSGLFDDKLAYLFPSGSAGYLVGFILAAWLVGKLVEGGWSTPIKAAAAALIGAVVIYLPGLAWLGIWAARALGMDDATAMSSALEWGLYPFVLGDAVKAIIAGLGTSTLAGWFARK